MPTTIGQALAVVAGCVLLYVAFFLKEDEEGRLQNWLEQFWHHIERAQDSVLSVQAAFLKQVAHTSSMLIDRWFGRSLFTVRAFSISCALSIASVYLLLFDRAGWDSLDNPTYRTTLAVACVFAVFAILPGFVDWAKWLPLAMVGLLSLVSLTLPPIEHGQRPPPFGLWSLDDFREPVLLGVLLVSVMADFVSLAVGRRLLRMIQPATGTIRIVSLLMATSVLPYAFMRLPLTIFPGMGNPPTPFELTVYNFLVFLHWSNYIGALVSAVFVLVALIALLHRIVWPVLWRPVMAAHRFGLVQNRKLLGTLGLGLITGSPFGKQVEEFVRHYLRY
jgi:hypothetical protein